MTVVITTQMSAAGTLPPAATVGLLVVVCVFIAGHAWGWGPMVRRRAAGGGADGGGGGRGARPLDRRRSSSARAPRLSHQPQPNPAPTPPPPRQAWLVVSEVQPLHTRAAGTALGTMINFIMSFVVGQSVRGRGGSGRWGGKQAERQTAGAAAAACGVTPGSSPEPCGPAPPPEPAVAPAHVRGQVLRVPVLRRWVGTLPAARPAHSPSLPAIPHTPRPNRPHPPEPHT
jgi:hypothetical protein